MHFLNTLFLSDKNKSEKYLWKQKITEEKIFENSKRKKKWFLATNRFNLNKTRFVFFFSILDFRWFFFGFIENDVEFEYSNELENCWFESIRVYWATQIIETMGRQWMMVVKVQFISYIPKFLLNNRSVSLSSTYIFVWSSECISICLE